MNEDMAVDEVEAEEGANVALVSEIPQKCQLTLKQRLSAISIQDIVVETEEESEETDTEEEVDQQRSKGNLLNILGNDDGEEQCGIGGLFSSFVSDLTLDGIDKVDVFKDVSLYNTDEINETATSKSKNIFDFLDDELEVKQVNIKQFLDSHQRVESTNVRDSFVL